MSQIVFTEARLIPLLLLAVPVIGSVLTYYLAVLQDHVKPFFPFVSHAAGYPPQSAVFSTLIEITAFLGILTSILRYVVMEQRRSSVELKTLKKLNGIALCFGCLAFLGLIYLALNPVGFPTAHKHDYIWSVGVTHNVGAFGALICFDVYVLIQSYLMFHQSETHKQNGFLHRCLVAAILTSSLIIVAIFYFVAVDFIARIPDEETGHFALPNFQYTFIPLTTAVLEWIFAISVFIFFATFSGDFKYIRITLHLHPKFLATEGRIISLPQDVSQNGCDFFGNGPHAVSSVENKKKKEQ